MFTRFTTEFFFSLLDPERLFVFIDIWLCGTDYICCSLSWSCYSYVI